MITFLTQSEGRITPNLANHTLAVTEGIILVEVERLRTMVSKYSRIKSKKSPNGDLVPTGDTPILIKLCSFTHNNASIRDIL